MKQSNDISLLVHNLLSEDDSSDRIIFNNEEGVRYIDDLCLTNLTDKDFFDFLNGDVPLPHIEIEVHGYYTTLIGEVKIKRHGQMALEGLDWPELNVAHTRTLQGNPVSVVPCIGAMSIQAKSFQEGIEGFISQRKDGTLTLVSPKINESTVANWGDAFIGLITNYIGIQLALLHPEIREVIETGKIMAVDEKGKTLSKKAAKRQRVARYIKIHNVDDAKLKEAQRRSFKRKCKAWFVLGHWRQYKDGHRTFIQGYWKGPLREYKRNFDNVRIREVN